MQLPGENEKKSRTSYEFVCPPIHLIFRLAAGTYQGLGAAIRLEVVYTLEEAVAVQVGLKGYFSKTDGVDGKYVFWIERAELGHKVLMFPTSFGFLLQLQHLLLDKANVLRGRRWKGFKCT